MLVLSSAVLGTMIGLLATAFQLLLDSIFRIKQILFSFSGGNIFIEIAMSISLTIIMVLVFVRKFAKEAGGSGIQEVEGALKGCRKLRKRVIF